MTTDAKDPIVIVGAARTPMGGFQGDLKDLTAPELGGAAIGAALDRAGVAPGDVDDVIMGLCLFAAVKQAPARQAAHHAGIPWQAGCTTISKMCGSAMKAAMLAHDTLLAGTHEVMVAGGMESMSNAPYLLGKARKGYRLGHGDEVKDHMFLDGLEDAYEEGKLMGCFAEDTATAYQFTREAQDDFAIESLGRAKKAIEDGTFGAEVVPVTVKTRKGETVVERDEQPLKADIGKIRKLKPAFAEDGTVTAANSSSISDGGRGAGVDAPFRSRKTGYYTYCGDPRTRHPRPGTGLVHHRAHRRHREAFGQDRLEQGRGRSVRDQRSLRRRHHGGHAGPGYPRRQGQRPRRRLRAGPSHRRVRRAYHRHPVGGVG